MRLSDNILNEAYRRIQSGEKSYANLKPEMKAQYDAFVQRLQQHTPKTAMGGRPYKPQPRPAGETPPERMDWLERLTYKTFAGRLGGERLPTSAPGADEPITQEALRSYAKSIGKPPPKPASPTALPRPTQKHVAATKYKYASPVGQAATFARRAGESVANLPMMPVSIGEALAGGVQRALTGKAPVDPHPISGRYAQFISEHPEWLSPLPVALLGGKQAVDEMAAGTPLGVQEAGSLVGALVGMKGLSPVLRRGSTAVMKTVPEAAVKRLAGAESRLLKPVTNKAGQVAYSAMEPVARTGVEMSLMNPPVDIEKAKHNLQAALLFGVGGQALRGAARIPSRVLNPRDLVALDTQVRSLKQAGHEAAIEWPEVPPGMGLMGRPKLITNAPEPLISPGLRKYVVRPMPREEAPLAWPEFVPPEEGRPPITMADRAAEDLARVAYEIRQQQLAEEGVRNADTQYIRDRAAGAYREGNTSYEARQQQLAEEAARNADTQYIRDRAAGAYREGNTSYEARQQQLAEEAARNARQLDTGEETARRNIELRQQQLADETARNAEKRRQTDLESMDEASRTSYEEQQRLLAKEMARNAEIRRQRDLEQGAFRKDVESPVVTPSEPPRSASPEPTQGKTPTTPPESPAGATAQKPRLRTDAEDAELMRLQEKANTGVTIGEDARMRELETLGEPETTVNVRLSPQEATDAMGRLTEKIKEVETMIDLTDNPENRAELLGERNRLQALYDEAYSHIIPFDKFAVRSEMSKKAWKTRKARLATEQAGEAQLKYALPLAGAATTGLAGAAYGAATGDTPEERRRRALGYAIYAGVGIPSALALGVGLTGLRRPVRGPAEISPLREVGRIVSAPMTRNLAAIRNAGNFDEARADLLNRAQKFVDEKEWADYRESMGLIDAVQAQGHKTLFEPLWQQYETAVADGVKQSSRWTYEVGTLLQKMGAREAKRMLDGRMRELKEGHTVEIDPLTKKATNKPIDRATLSAPDRLMYDLLHRIDNEFVAETKIPGIEGHYPRSWNAWELSKIIHDNVPEGAQPGTLSPRLRAMLNFSEHQYPDLHAMPGFTKAFRADLSNIFADAPEAKRASYGRLEHQRLRAIPDGYVDPYTGRYVDLMVRDNALESLSNHWERGLTTSKIWDQFGKSEEGQDMPTLVKYFRALPKREVDDMSARWRDVLGGYKHDPGYLESIARMMTNIAYISGLSAATLPSQYLSVIKQFADYGAANVLKAMIPAATEHGFSTAAGSLRAAERILPPLMALQPVLSATRNTVFRLMPKVLRDVDLAVMNESGGLHGSRQFGESHSVLGATGKNLPQRGAEITSNLARKSVGGKLVLNSDRHTRIWSIYSAMLEANGLLQRAQSSNPERAASAKAELARMGVSDIAGAIKEGKFSDIDNRNIMYVGGKNVPVSGPGDMAPWMNTPVGRVFMQFGRVPFAEAGATADALKLHPKRFLQYSAGLVTASLVIDEMRRVLTGGPEPEDGLDRLRSAMSNMAWLSTLGRLQPLWEGQGVSIPSTRAVVGLTNRRGLLKTGLNYTTGMGGVVEGMIRRSERE